MAHRTRYGLETRRSSSGGFAASRASASTRNRCSVAETTRRSVGCGPASTPVSRSTERSSAGNGVNVGPASTRRTRRTFSFQSSASHHGTAPSAPPAPVRPASRVPRHRSTNESRSPRLAPSPARRSARRRRRPAASRARRRRRSSRSTRVVARATRHSRPREPTPGFRLAAAPRSTCPASSTCSRATGGPPRPVTPRR